MHVLKCRLSSVVAGIASGMSGVTGFRAQMDPTLVSHSAVSALYLYLIYSSCHYGRNTWQPLLKINTVLSHITSGLGQFPLTTWARD